MTSQDDPKNKPGRVIVTYGRSLIALIIAHSLGSRGVEIIGCDDVDLTVLSFSRFVLKNHVYTSPADDPEKFIADLKTIVQTHKPDDDRPYILMPGFKEAEIIAKHKEEFEGLITLAAPSAEAIEKIHPKDNFFRTARQYDLAVPKTCLPENRNSLEQCLEELEFPVMIKPPHEAGGRGISRHQTKEGVLKAYEVLTRRYKGKQIIVQEARPGEDYCFCALYYKGDWQASMVYQNLLKYPAGSGPGVVRETVKKDKFDEIADRLLSRIEWTGVIELDFLWTGKEEDLPIMIEANPRFWSGLDHSVKSGIDFPWLLYCVAQGNPCPRDSSLKAKEGHKTSLPGLASLASMDQIISSAVHFEKLEQSWPEIRKHINKNEYYQAGTVFKDAMKDSVTPGEALQAFQALREQAKEIENLSFVREDPFVGLGVLYVMACLIRHGRLPPELKRK